MLTKSIKLGVSNWGEGMSHTTIFVFLGEPQETGLKFLAGNVPS